MPSSGGGGGGAAGIPGGGRKSHIDLITINGSSIHELSESESRIFYIKFSIKSEFHDVQLPSDKKIN